MAQEEADAVKLPRDVRRADRAAEQMRAVLHKVEPVTDAELDAIAEFWLLLASAAASGDAEAQAFLAGTFDPWASATFKARAS